MTPARERRPYGTWPSPITAASVAAGTVRFDGLQADSGSIYWIEGRPREGGRCVIVRHADGVSTDLLPPPFSARTFVHEYGGGAMRAFDGDVYFSNAQDRLLYRVSFGKPPEQVTPPLGDVRFADMTPDRARQRLIAVVEQHDELVVNDIRSVPLGAGESRTLVSGNDFYASPRVSPDGTRLCWLTWNQPNMPWDGCELWVATIADDGTLRDATRVAGGATEATFQPTWAPDGSLVFASDRTGWWNLYRWDGTEHTPLAPMRADCGRPQWVFGMRTFVFTVDGDIALTACHDGVWRMHAIDVRSGAVRDVDLPYTTLGAFMDADGDSVVLVAGGPRDATAVVRVSPTTGHVTVLRAPDTEQLDESLLSAPEHVTFPGHAGATSHAWYYRPRNDAIEPEPGTLPPLVVHAHGGPTSATSASSGLDVQYWTSRGFAYLDVDYGGSTGYGRAYRQRLDGHSGVVDVGDCVAGARHLAERGEVDGARLFITGGSAGGYIVLCAMTFHDVFAAGASLYGISDVQALIAETHKFEARYDSPYPTDPEELRRRSPVHFVDRVRRAVLLLQGVDDPIVLASQSEMMFEALRRTGVPCAYLAFEGEGHGFRRAEHVARALDAQLYFFARVTAMAPPDGVTPVEIANLQTS